MLQKDHQAIDILLAEIDIYELFAFKHCKGRKVKLALCEGNFFFKLRKFFGKIILKSRGAGATGLVQHKIENQTDHHTLFQFNSLSSLVRVLDS